MNKRSTGLVGAQSIESFLGARSMRLVQLVPLVWVSDVSEITRRSATCRSCLSHWAQDSRLGCISNNQMGARSFYRAWEAYMVEISTMF